MVAELGDRIRQARKKKGYKQADLAEKIGVSTSAIGFMEVGKSKPTLENLVKISEICAVDLTWLLKGEVTRKVSSEIAEKSLDNGAFGGEVEAQLRYEIEQIKQDFKSKEEKYLEIIRNLSLGKDEVTKLIATVFEKETDLVTYNSFQAPKMLAIG